jgi:hypothetical protein
MSLGGDGDVGGTIIINPVRHLIEILPIEQSRIVAVCIKPSSDILLTTVNLIIPKHLPDLFSTFTKEEIETAQKILPVTILYAVAACVCYEFQYLIPHGLSVADSISTFVSRLDSNTNLVVKTILQSIKINSPKGGDYYYTKETYTRNVLQPILIDNMAKNPIPQANVGLSPYKISQLLADAADSVMDNFYTVIAPNLPDVEIIPYFLKNMEKYFLPKATEYYLKFAPIALYYPPSTYNPVYPSTDDELLKTYVSMNQTVYSPGEALNVEIFKEIISQP